MKVNNPISPYNLQLVKCKKLFAKVKTITWIKENHEPYNIITLPLIKEYMVHGFLLSTL